MLLAFIDHFWATLVDTAVALSTWMPALAVAIALEWVSPGRRPKFWSVLINMIYLPLALALSTILVSPVIAWLKQGLPNDWFGLSGFKTSPLASLAIWLTYLMAFDFLYYWFHRAQHTFGFLWRFHLVHHSDANVSASTVGRHHWMEDGLRFFFITAPLIALLGGTADMPFWATAFVILNGIFMHWNVSFRFGPLENGLVTPAYHRIHHSIEERHYNKNFGVFTQVWDGLFGTRHRPAAGEFPDTGVQGFPERNTLPLLLPWPVVLARKSNEIARAPLVTKP